jgi:hypothetical protein
LLTTFTNIDLVKGRALIEQQEQRAELNQSRNVTPICKSLIRVKCVSKKLYHTNVTSSHVCQDYEEQSV